MKCITAHVIQRCKAPAAQVRAVVGRDGAGGVFRQSGHRGSGVHVLPDHQGEL